MGRTGGTRNERFEWVRALLPALLLLSGCGPEAEVIPELPVGAEVGYRPPPLHGTLADGSIFMLAAIPTQPVVMVFYQSASCGLCRVQLGDLQRNLGGYRQQGVEPIAVTLDSPESSRQLVADLGLQFAVVSVDPGTFDSWRAMKDGVTLPATYIVDRQGVIRYRHIGRNASDRALDAEILTVIATLDLD